MKANTHGAIQFTNGLKTSRDQRRPAARFISALPRGYDIYPAGARCHYPRKAPSFFVMNGHDLIMILTGAMPLPEFLKRRVRLLAEEGCVCVTFAELL